MDELLFDRVQQLNTIEERLERIEQLARNVGAKVTAVKMLNELRRDVYIMVQKAEQEHAEF